MASILDFDADASSDENDGDYVPPTGVPSDSSGLDEDSCDDLESEQKPKSKAKRNVSKNKEPEPEVKPDVPPVDEKKRAESLWLDFLTDVSKTDSLKKPSIQAIESQNVPKSNDSDSKSAKMQKTVEPQVFEFAGEIFTANGEVSSHSHVCCKDASEADGNEKKSSKESTPFMPKKRGGLEAVLGSIANKKKKLSTLEKTHIDWKAFKKNEGIEEDLEKFNKGKGGFIERQRFLERSDVRSFEVEKSMRISKRRM